MQLPIFKHISEIIDNYDLFLFDLWGVITENDALYPGVIESINNILRHKKVFFVSNVPRPAFIMKDKLLSWGLNNITEEMIITSGDIARKLMLEEKHRLNLSNLIIYHLGDVHNKDILYKFEHILTDNYNKADIILLSLHRDENQDIREFDELLKNIAKEKSLLTICSNPDISVPKGNITRYCAGYFAQIIEQNGGKVIYTGKPKDIIYQTVFERAGPIKKDRILMIGDTFETDILGAQDAGIHSALVLTGNAYKIHSNHKSLNDKLVVLGKKAEELKIYPTFITEISI